MIAMMATMTNTTIMAIMAAEGERFALFAPGSGVFVAVAVAVDFSGVAPDFVVAVDCAVDVGVVVVEEEAVKSTTANGP
jgi:hypothetical protein